jgi:hypothetical protein
MQKEANERAKQMEQEKEEGEQVHQRTYIIRRQFRNRCVKVPNVKCGSACFLYVSWGELAIV